MVKCKYNVTLLIHHQISGRANDGSDAEYEKVGVPQVFQVSTFGPFNTNVIARVAKDQVKRRNMVSRVLKIERVKTKDIYKCPNNCLIDCDAPFFYPISIPDLHYDLGVLAHPDLTLSNRWDDGTVGVPKAIVDWINSHGSLPHCTECMEEVVKKGVEK